MGRYKQEKKYLSHIRLHLYKDRLTDTTKLLLLFFNINPLYIITLPIHCNEPGNIKTQILL